MAKLWARPTGALPVSVLQRGKSLENLIEHTVQPRLITSLERLGTARRRTVGA